MCCAASLRRDGSSLSSPYVGFGFWLLVLLPAVAESWSDYSCRRGCRCPFTGIDAAWWIRAVGFCGFSCVGPLRRWQLGKAVVRGERWPWPVVVVTGETPGRRAVLQRSPPCTFLLFFMVSSVLMKMGVVLLILINEIPILSQKKTN